MTEKLGLPNTNLPANRVAWCILGQFIGMCVAFVMTAQTVHAEDIYTPLMERSACEPVYAVHKLGCNLQRFYTCEYEGQMIQRAESISKDGLYFVDFTDMEGNTIRSWSVNGHGMTVEVHEVRKLFSQETIVKQGHDSFDYTELSTHRWFAEPIPAIFAGEFVLTGEVLSVDDVTFTEVRLRGYQQFNGFRTEIDRYDYFDFESRAFLWGGKVQANGSTLDESSYEPVRVILPDNPVFQIDRPIYECGAISSIAPLANPSAKG